MTVQIYCLCPFRLRRFTSRKSINVDWNPAALAANHRSNSNTSLFMPNSARLSAATIHHAPTVSSFSKVEKARRLSPWRQHHSPSRKVSAVLPNVAEYVVSNFAPAIDDNNGNVVPHSKSNVL